MSYYGHHPGLLGGPAWGQVTTPAAVYWELEQFKSRAPWAQPDDTPARYPEKAVIAAKNMLAEAADPQQPAWADLLQQLRTRAWFGRDWERVVFDPGVRNPFTYANGIKSWLEEGRETLQLQELRGLAPIGIAGTGGALYRLAQSIRTFGARLPAQTPGQLPYSAVTDPMAVPAFVNAVTLTYRLSNEYRAIRLAEGQFEVWKDTGVFSDTLHVRVPEWRRQQHLGFMRELESSLLTVDQSIMASRTNTAPPAQPPVMPPNEPGAQPPPAYLTTALGVGVGFVIAGGLAFGLWWWATRGRGRRRPAARPQVPGPRPGGNGGLVAPPRRVPIAG